ncbi:carboxylating nicotinate-nucleotide diphosphorylase [Frankia sp. Cas3]|uniref:carboxylating nicotinate-nucleotide diphosphorylase n=1 Tax=Frankia sp. Cas3 TaxID=3073926 RepID=UPI002AD1DF98|nr:carboxylating nicotinate-nucleotide diphosphorylase [Frankia sp. Cas3]
MPVSAPIRGALVSAGLDPGMIIEIVRRAVCEDLTDGLVGAVDATSVATVAPDLQGRAAIVSRARGVVAGLPVAAAVFEIVLAEQYGSRDDVAGIEPAPRSVSERAGGMKITIGVSDGDRVGPGDAVLTVAGPVRALLTAERTALNLLCHLSGVATATRRWVDAVDGTGAAIRDTRKTLPGLRALEKYAVRCGGGVNHRMSLADAALVKDNHVIAAGGVAAAFTAVRTRFPGLAVEVECDTQAQVVEAVAAGADLILCDNMTPDELRESVALARPAGVAVEASGGLTLAVARAVAETGVNFLAVGALTHSAPALDLGLDLSLDLSLDLVLDQRLDNHIEPNQDRDL